MKIIITVSSIKPVVDMIEVDLGWDVPVDRSSILSRINDMIDEAFECLIPIDDLRVSFERLLEDTHMDDDELLFSAPDVYLFKQLLDELRLHPLTQRQTRKLRHIQVVGVFGDFLLHYQ